LGRLIIGAFSSSDAMTTHDTLINPRIQTLSEEVAAGKHGVLETFWQNVQQFGTPLIERTDDDSHALVTFLWRATEPGAGVKLIRGLTQRDDNRSALFHLPHTDLWYRTFRARSDTRALYLLLPTGGSAQVDPCNPKTYHYPADEDHPNQQAFTVSVVELPQAPAQPWVQPQPTIAKGHLQRHTFQSAILSNQRRLWVYTPPDYSGLGTAYDLLILFDGWLYAHTLRAPVTLDNLIGAGKLPALVAIMLDSPNRMQELLCYPPFADFLAHELLPWAQHHFHVTPTPMHRTVGGLSAGGVAAAYVGFRYPALFGNVLAQSGAFWWRPPDDCEPEWLARQFARSARLPLHFSLDVGLLEEWTEGDEGVSQLVSTRHLRTVLRAKGYRVAYREFSGDHDEICWQGTFADGLLSLVNDRASA
jgi:enterochelin esterase-like enzyme